MFAGCSDAFNLLFAHLRMLQEQTYIPVSSMVYFKFWLNRFFLSSPWELRTSPTHLEIIIIYKMLSQTFLYRIPTMESFKSYSVYFLLVCSIQKYPNKNIVQITWRSLANIRVRWFSWWAPVWHEILSHRRFCAPNLHMANYVYRL